MHVDLSSSALPAARGLTLAAMACALSLSVGCGDKKKPDTVVDKDPSSTTSSAVADAKLKAVLQKSPASSGKAPADLIPNQMRWVLSSDDPAAWKAFFEARPSVKALMASPLGDDIRTHDAMQSLRGLQVQVQKVARLFGDTDADMLWQGPTAIGVRSLDDKHPRFVLVKHLGDKAAVLRFAGGLLQFVPNDGAPQGGKPSAEVRLNDVEKDGVQLRQVQTRGHTISYTFFQDLVVVGVNEEDVLRAARLGLGKPKDHSAVARLGVTKGKDVSAQNAGRVPGQGEQGLHISRRFGERSLPTLVGFDDLGMTLTTSEKTPMKLRAATADVAPTSFAALKYVPGTSFFAVASAAKPNAGILDELLRRDTYSSKLKSKKAKALKVGAFSLDKQLLAHLDAPVAVAFGAGAEGAGLTPVVVIAHQKRTDVESGAKAAYNAIVGKPNVTKLAALGNATLLTGNNAAPVAAITDDVLLLGLDEETVRAALSAGAGQTLSLKDRQGLALDKQGTAFVYADAKKAQPYLEGFYKSTLSTSNTTSWNEAQPVLAPVFAALAQAGGGAALLQPTTDGRSAGDFTVLP